MWVRVHFTICQYKFWLREPSGGGFPRSQFLDPVFAFVQVCFQQMMLKVPHCYLLGDLCRLLSWTWWSWSTLGKLLLCTNFIWAFPSLSAWLSFYLFAFLLVCFLREQIPKQHVVAIEPRGPWWPSATDVSPHSSLSAFTGTRYGSVVLPWTEGKGLFTDSGKCLDSELYKNSCPCPNSKRNRTNMPYVKSYAKYDAGFWGFRRDPPDLWTPSLSSVLTLIKNW